MRKTVIPAQVTTVEDKIAGNLSMTQIFILLIPVFFGIFIFAIFPPSMHLVIYKIPPVLLVLLISLILSLRIKGKVVLNWLSVLFAYNARPKYYVFNKNDTYLRDIPEFEESQEKEAEKITIKKELAIPAKTFGLKELRTLETFIKNPNYSFSLKPGRKGGIYVIISEIDSKKQ